MVTWYTSWHKAGGVWNFFSTLKKRHTRCYDKCLFDVFCECFVHVKHQKPVAHFFPHFVNVEKESKSQHGWIESLIYFKKNSSFAFIPIWPTKCLQFTYQPSLSVKLPKSWTKIKVLQNDKSPHFFSGNSSRDIALYHPDRGPEVFMLGVDGNLNATVIPWVLPALRFDEWKWNPKKDRCSVNSTSLAYVRSLSIGLCSQKTSPSLDKLLPCFHKDSTTRFDYQDRRKFQIKAKEQIFPTQTQMKWIWA